MKEDRPSVYLGETSRSLYERGREHWQAYREGREDSHILKHHILHHEGKGEPKFYLKPLQFHRTALNRQITEGVKISRFGESNLLNSKAEYNRSKISRLSLGEHTPDLEIAVDKEKDDDDEKNRKWEDRKVKELNKEDKKVRKRWVKVNDEWQGKTTPKRRKEDDNTDSCKKKKFKNYGEGCWGERRQVQVVGLAPYYPQPQRERVARTSNQVAKQVVELDNRKPGIFKVQDIRLYLKPIPRVESQAGQQQTNVTEREGTFVEEAKMVEKVDEVILVTGKDVKGSEDVKNCEEITVVCQKTEEESPGLRTPSGEDKKQKSKDDRSQVLKTPMMSSMKKRRRYEEEHIGSSMKKMKHSGLLQDEGYVDARRSIVEELFDEDLSWCLLCAQSPCLCLLMKTEMKIIAVKSTKEDKEDDERTGKEKTEVEDEVFLPNKKGGAGIKVGGKQVSMSVLKRNKRKVSRMKDDEIKEARKMMPSLKSFFGVTLRKTEQKGEERCKESQPEQIHHNVSAVVTKNNPCIVRDEEQRRGDS